MGSQLNIVLCVCLCMCVTVRPWTKRKYENRTQKHNTLVQSEENIKNEEDLIESDEMRKIKYKNNKQGKKKTMSKYELTILRCCSSPDDRNVNRCFEVNGIRGVHFLKQPCKPLEQTLEKIKDIEKEIKIKNKKNKIFSKYEKTIIKCCSSSEDTSVERCFEVNGFGGINFLKKPCKPLEMILETTNNMEK